MALTLAGNLLIHFVDADALGAGTGVGNATRDRGECSVEEYLTAACNLLILLGLNRIEKK